MVNSAIVYFNIKQIVNSELLLRLLYVPKYSLQPGPNRGLQLDILNIFAYTLSYSNKESVGKQCYDVPSCKQMSYELIVLYTFITRIFSFDTLGVAEGWHSSSSSLGTHILYSTAFIYKHTCSIVLWLRNIPTYLEYSSDLGTYLQYSSDLGEYVTTA
jgi:hypothetical protein